MTLRSAGKLIWFAAQIVVDVVDYFFRTAFVPKNSKRAARAAGLQRATRRHLKIFNFKAEVSGPVPSGGLIVSNHLSYLDILVLSSVTPAVFVSKADVRRWPVFGWLSMLGGTVYIERERRTHVGAVNREIVSALADGVPVVVFPEGTSSDGQTILPFRSSLLEPVASGTHAITTSWIHYTLGDGDAGQEICYWGDHSFFPHLLNLLDKQKISAKVCFGKFERTTDDRKELAKHLQTAVEKLTLHEGS
jgi:1-acyl-sn-glycerol-3-phosphate acyltransferase